LIGLGGSGKESINTIIAKKETGYARQMTLIQTPKVKQNGVNLLLPGLKKILSNLRIN